MGLEYYAVDHKRKAMLAIGSRGAALEELVASAPRRIEDFIEATYELLPGECATTMALSSFYLFCSKAGWDVEIVEHSGSRYDHLYYELEYDRLTPSEV
jgi:hypothetical protein